MELRHLFAVYFGLPPEKRDVPTNLTSEQQDYRADLSRVQADVAAIIPASVISFWNDPDNGLLDYYSLGADVLSESWFGSLGDYVTGSNFQELLDHSTESWYRSYTSNVGRAGPLESIAADVSLLVSFRTKSRGASDGAAINTPSFLAFVGGLALALL